MLGTAKSSMRKMEKHNTHKGGRRILTSNPWPGPLPPRHGETCQPSPVSTQQEKIPTYSYVTNTEDLLQACTPCADYHDHKGP